MAEAAKICPRCEAKVLAGTWFCTKCGQELLQVAEPRKKPARRTSGRKRLVIVLVSVLSPVCLLCGAIGVAGSLLTPSYATPTGERSAEVVQMASPTLTIQALLSTDVPPHLTASPVPATDTPTPAQTAIPTDLVLPTLTQEPLPERTEAQVVDVVDGDTIKIQIEGETYTLRYIGIDTPETVHPSRPVEWMGPEASAANKAIVGGQTVYLEKDISETDRYDRLLRYVFLPDGTFVNAELVRQGYAVASTYPPDVKYQDLFRQMEQEARDAGRGLWAATPMPAAVPTMTAPAPAQSAPSGSDNVQIIEVLNADKKEYVEITNQGSVAGNLGGWSVSGSHGDDRYTFPVGYVLGPGTSVRLHSGQDGIDAPPSDIYWTTSNVWNNDGETVYLRNAQGTLIDEYGH